MFLRQEQRGDYMKKSFLLLGIAFSILSLASCHTPYSVESFEVPNNFDESKNYNIEFWAKNDGSTSQTKIYQKAIDEFEELYPNISITIRI